MCTGIVVAAVRDRAEPASLTHTMATKNLGRSALEGGRYGHYQVRVREIESSFRTANRGYTRRAEVDPDTYDEDSDPVRHPKSKRGNQTDKLSGIYRMLDGMVGRPWAKVRAEIAEKFDARTLAGRHVLHDHILKDIAPHEDVEHSYGGGRYSHYYVDRYGIFRERAERQYPQYKRQRISRDAFNKIAAWLDGRGIIRSGSKLYWGHPQVRIEIQPNYDNVPIYHRLISMFDRVLVIPWRQERELKGKDLAFFQGLPDFVASALIALDIQHEAAA